MQISAYVMLASFGAASVWAGINEWTSLGPDGGGANALVIDPQTTSTVYALTFAGIFKSMDGGATWSAVNSGLTAPCPPIAPGCASTAARVSYLVIDPTASNTVY